MNAAHPVLAVLRAHGTRELWHYTACANLPGIFGLGSIYSRSELEARSLEFVSEHYFGDDEKEEVLSRYVSCATLPPWGMMQDEEEELAILGLDPAVVAIAGTCFCPGWSPKAVFTAAEIVASTEPEHAEAIYTGPGYTTVMGAEIFVPNAIPVSYVTKVAFFDLDSGKAARDTMMAAMNKSGVDVGQRRTIALKVEPWRFPRDWREEGPPWMRGEEETDEPMF